MTAKRRSPCRRHSLFSQDVAIAVAADFERVAHGCPPMMTFRGTYPEVFHATVAAFVVCAEPGCTVARAPGIDEGRAPTFVTSTVTKRASSQSAHLPALTSRSARYTALYCGVREW